jgi:hypothetical protein
VVVIAAFKRDTVNSNLAIESARLAQSVERVTLMIERSISYHKVAGSTPALGSIPITDLFFGFILQF